MYKRSETIMLSRQLLEEIEELLYPPVDFEAKALELKKEIEYLRENFPEPIEKEISYYPSTG